MTEQTIETTLSRWAANSKAATDQFDRMVEDVKGGWQKYEQVLRHISEQVIDDQLDFPADLSVSADNYADNGKQLELSYMKRGKSVKISRHAMQQLCGIAEFPLAYSNKLVSECAGMPERTRLDLLEGCLNTHLQRGMYRSRSKDSQLLSRVVQGTLRGLLSNRYNLLLPTVPLLAAFMETSRAMGAFLYDATMNDTRVVVRVVLPHILSPVPGEHVVFGLGFANSDFGAGKLKVTSFLLRPHSRSILVGADSLSKVHLGKLVEESDIQLSKETQLKGIQASQSVVRDAVRDLWSTSRVEAAMAGVVEATEKNLPWATIAKRLNGVFTKEELEAAKRMATGETTLPELPRLEFAEDKKTLLTTAWWTASYVGHLAAQQEDASRREELQELAGSFLTGMAA